MVLRVMRRNLCILFGGVCFPNLRGKNAGLAKPHWDIDSFIPSFCGAITEEALKKRIHPLEPEDLKYLDNFDDPDMSIEEKLQSLQSLSLPEEQRCGHPSSTRMEARTPGIHLQEIRVLCRHSSTERSRKSWCNLHAIPSPPLESSSDNDPISPIRSLGQDCVALIEEEKSSIDGWSQTISFYCCSIRKNSFRPFRNYRPTK
ncbi:uncharacterized protein CDAR_120251 [Caerostris darwini]|uniref:Uncharacterized protein n=1 Tax=Caerostris darwini TaxID=1538125 RepID=A0AAV4R9B3_9ARAC|nr:uncharacterized protein CDAR_120251 [Caerostris darwini]